MFFDKMDTNGHDVISGSEIPDRFRALAPLAGVTLPERITRDDFEKWFDALRKRIPLKKTEKQE